MAIVKGSVIGNLSGKLGHLAARTVAGRTILSARPASFNASQDPVMIEIRKKFSSTAAFVKTLISLTALYEIWKKSKPPVISVYNFAFKSNFALSSAERPTAQNILTPGGFPLPVDEALVTPDNVSVGLLALNTEAIFTPEEVNLSANGLICYYNPENPGDPAYQVTSLNSELADYDFSQPFTVDISLNVIQKAVAAKYRSSILFFTVASKNTDGKVIQYSATYNKNNL